MYTRGRWSKSWPLAREMYRGSGPPCAGHAMLAALEVDDAVLEEEDTR